MHPIRLHAGLAALLALSACSSAPSTRGDPRMFVQQRESAHRGGDDLLTAGLGLTGLRAMAPASADAASPTPAELRRRALWANWRGIADLAPGGGYGELYGSAARVPGREFSALARVPGASQPHRVLVQVPDAFDAGKRCLVVTASSGSRGIYGAIAVAGAWGLPRGCAVAYTDKGAGTDYFDLDAGRGFDAAGRVAPVDAADLAFLPTPTTGTGIAFKHAHSQDNPEADWGRHVRQAADYGLHALDRALPAQAPFTYANTRVIAVGLSNGGAAVLRAAADPDPWLDAVVAGEPSVLASGHGARALFDYATEAALLMPCANIGLRLPPVPGGIERCIALAEQGVLASARNGYGVPAADALQRLRAAGWSDEALRAGRISMAYDLWRTIAAGYASAYGRYPHDAHPCGYRYAGAVEGKPTPLPAWAHAALWADASGIPPASPIQLFNPGMAADPLPGLQCLRTLWTGDGEAARRVRAGIEQTRVRTPRQGLPVVIVHGTADGLVPPAFSSAPYVAMANAAGRDVRFWQLRNVQHFDAFLGLPYYAADYLPLLPYLYSALDRVDAYLDSAGALPATAVIAGTPRAGQPLGAAHLALPD